MPLFLWGLAFAQAPTTGIQQAAPVVPKTPDVVAPPPLTLAPPAVVDVGAKPLSIAEAVAIALRRQPQMQAAQGNVTIAVGQTQQAAAPLHPQLSANASAGPQYTFVGYGLQPSAISLGLAITQLLYDFGRTRDQVRQQEALQRSAEQNFTETAVSVTLQVKQDYYSLLQAKDDVDLESADVANRKRQLDEASARVTSGIGAPSDLVQAKTNLAEAMISLVSFRNGALSAQVALAQDLGIDPRTPLAPVAATQEQPVADEGNVKALVTAALSQRPDVHSAREQVAAAGYGLSAAKKGLLPAVTVTAGGGGTGVSDPFVSQFGTVTLGVTWTFSDGGSTAGQIKQQTGAIQVAKSNLSAVSQQAITDVSNASIDLAGALQRLDLAQTESVNAQELVRISEGLYDGGLGQFLDITNAQASLVTAQTNLVQAKADVQRARARLRGAIGATE